MGEDLSLDGREAIRTPMQWDDTSNAGFSRSAARRSFSTRCHEGSVWRKEGQRTRAATRPEFAAALVREPDTHPAYRAGDRDRYLLGHRRPAAALGAGAPIRRARRVDLAAAQFGRHHGHGGYRRAAGHERQPVRPVRRRPIRRTDREADRPRAERLGIPMDTSIPKRSRLTGRMLARRAGERGPATTAGHPKPDEIAHITTHPESYSSPAHESARPPWLLGSRRTACLASRHPFPKEKMRTNSVASVSPTIASQVPRSPRSGPDRL